MFDRLFRWTPKRLQQWEALRAQGKRHYVVWYGIVRYGGFMFIWMLGFMIIQNRTRLTSLLDIVVLVVINLVVWPLAGLVYGMWMWSLMNTAYTRYQHQKTQESA